MSNQQGKPKFCTLELCILRREVLLCLSAICESWCTEGGACGVRERDQECRGWRLRSSAARTCVGSDEHRVRFSDLTHFIQIKPPKFHNAEIYCHTETGLHFHVAACFMNSFSDMHMRIYCSNASFNANAKKGWYLWMRDHGCCHLSSPKH